MSMVRSTCGLLAALLLGGCMMATGPVAPIAPVEITPPAASVPPSAAEPAPEPVAALAEPVVVPPHYTARSDGAHWLPAIDPAWLHPALLRSEVEYATTEAPGTIVIDTSGPFLYLVEDAGHATRYGIAVGREGFGWTGNGQIARKSQWPRWTPPPEMIARDPSLEKWRDGQPGGADNPLGARALYIYFGDQDSGYRIHGTNLPKSIGYAASSGCFRMLNQDVIDLYDRVQPGARVVVL